MNENLAERLLANVMKWEPKDIARERPDLQCLATFKYDDYQPFSPGMRFLESLASWLRQFSTYQERLAAYEFVRKRMIFISPKEMHHLVTISYSDYIRPFLMKKVAARKDIPEWFIQKIVESAEFQILRRQSLFLGLSDGAHIDIFRRNNLEISHEQVLRTHEIQRERASDMLKKLEEDLKHILGRAPTNKETKFRMVFLLDDFSGSGLSYIRKKGSDYTGKIYRFYRSACTEDGDIQNLFESSELHVCLVLYVANTKACDYLEKSGKALFGRIPFDVQVVDPLPTHIKIDDENDKEFVEVLRKYYDSSIETKHYLVGRHYKPYLGFDECGLPLVLSHNTPNNSVCLLWYDEQHKYRGLFPRASRHRDEI